ncbi:two-component sensor histidine kinase [Fictibacillus phosphorivorans]|uniref:histidine kinase n=1 Tax=Fictibacillus phosphorivorans TaxID=1221500 RepID=A0A160IM90_9BACL|nr:HAMP domain-containing sensor histidine kinase [Fictibacillus phosphorivorans]ANC77301.1 two-component sensor histidine kinase [Fictibacillus phosphorivorans]
MNIKNRITLFSTVWLLIILLVTNSGIYLLFQKNLHDNALEGTETRMESLTEAVKTSTETKMNMTQLLRAYLPGDSMIRIITGDNRVAATSSRITDDDKVQEIKPTYRPNQYSEVKTLNGMVYTVSQHPVIWTDGEVVSLQLIEKESSIPNTLQILRIVLIIATLLILIPSYMGGRFLSRLILVPISNLTKTMEENQRRGTYKRITINKKSSDELNKMARTFNHMMDLLENNYKKQEQFVSDASHELRTPLTVIESYAKMLKRWGSSRPEILEEAVEAIHSESIRMKELTQQMLILARDESQVDLQLEQSDLVEMAKNAAKNMNKAYDRDIQVHSNLVEIHVECDSLKIKQVLIILLDNAIKYSSAAINVELTKQGNSVRFSVTDYGIGITKENLDKVYDRFFRVDQARSRDTGGAGLGLSIAKQIVSAHQGKLYLESEEGKGTTVTLEIPVKQS